MVKKEMLIMGGYDRELYQADQVQPMRTPLKHVVLGFTSGAKLVPGWAYDEAARHDPEHESHLKGSF